MVTVNEHVRALNAEAPSEVALLVREDALDGHFGLGFNPRVGRRSNHEVHLVF